MKHLQHMKVTPNTEVDEAFDCGEVSGQEDISPEKLNSGFWTRCPEVQE